MLFPIGDDNRGRTTTPVVNYVLIEEIGGGLIDVGEKFTYEFSKFPSESLLAIIGLSPAVS